MTDATRLYIGRPRYTRESELYEVRLGAADGPIIVRATPVPLCDGSRVLLAQGITGRVELWDSERPWPRMSGDIEVLAQMTVREDQTTSPTFVRWKPFSRAAREAKTATCLPQVPDVPKTETAAGKTSGVRP